MNSINQIQDIPGEVMLDLYAVMCRIRYFETTAESLFLKGELPGFLHSSIGQEASAAGVCGALRRDDCITTTHRGHGHVIAKGADVDKMMAELFGKATGYCKGKSGSMHIFDRALGILGANGIVGGGLPIATGAALSSLLQGNDRVIACFFGDGASDEGAFHESLNLASVYCLPVLFVCENNQYAESNHQMKHQRVVDIADRAAAYAIPSVICDGTDVIDVYRKTVDAVARLRGGGGPILMENKCYRWSGHYIGDPAVYRPKDEPKEWREKRDPIRLLASRLIEAGLAADGDLEDLAAAEKKRNRDAVEYAVNSPSPEAASALEDVYV